MQTQAWFRIANPESSWTKVSLVGLDDVDDLREAMQRKMPHTLGGYDPAQLTIMVKYGDKDSKDAVPLDPQEDLKEVLERFGRRDSSLTCTTSYTEKIWFFLFLPFGSYEGIKKTLKYHPPKGNALLSGAGCAWEYQRPENWRELIGKALEVQHRAFKIQCLGKNNAPLFLMLSGAGTGKSRSGKEFHDTLMEFAKSQEVKDRLEKAKVFHIALENGKTPLGPEIAKGVKSIISARMLAQVLEYPLDEVLCYPDLPALDTLCRQLAANEDLALQGAFIIPLCTATITGSPRKYLADTNRRRVFLELPPLHPPVIKASGKPAFPTGLVNDLLVSDCGGHGRALEALYQTYQTENLENITNYDDLVCLVISDLKDQYGDAFQRESHEYIAILKLVLSRTQLTRTSAIAGTGLTVELAEGNGLVRFEPAVDCQNTGYFSVPFIWIKTFVSLYDGQKENHPMSRFLANFLRYHEQIGILRNDPVKMQGWQLFENFAAGFRVLKSLSIDEGQQVKLSQIHYGATRSGPDLEFINRYMQHVHSTKEIRTSSFEESPVKVKCTAMRFSKSEAETIEAYIPSSRYCAVNGAHARGGDIFNLLEVSGLGTKVLEAGQCKKTAYLNSSSLWSEVKKVTPEGGVFVLYTTADLTEDLDTSKHCTSFFVKRDNYQNYFGPFAGRAFLRSRESLDTSSGTGQVG